MSEQKIQHFILTRFSYRSPEKAKNRKFASDWGANIDPLLPERLQHRFSLFESVCLPNVLSQTNQDFDWVLIIDPNLGDSNRTRLEHLVHQRKRSHLHTFCPNDDLTTADWLRPYWSTSANVLLTTLLDDDDLLPNDFVESLQSSAQMKNPASIRSLGVREGYNWDLFISDMYPFGTISPWHRAKFFRSAGFSVLANDSNVTCFGLDHSVGDLWYLEPRPETLFDRSLKLWGSHGLRPQPKFLVRHIKAWQKILSNQSVFTNLEDCNHNDLVTDLSLNGTFVLQVNHFWNDQRTRFIEPKPDFFAANKQSVFPDWFQINWNVLEQNKNRFSPPIAPFLSLLQKHGPKRINPPFFDAILKPHLSSQHRPNSS